ncbi:MAG: cardiolipin synthase [Herminiimonas sp.]|nr:cardiolipin synthase [Herminiimonas sp.]
MTWKTRSKKNKAVIIVTTIFATVLVTLLILNFTMGEKKVTREIAHLYTTKDPQFLRTMGLLLGPAMLDGNRVDTLLNGDEIFPSMLKEIRAAKKTITFESYIYWSEQIGKDFADALSERARAGVKVHVLVDWVGSSKLDESQIDEMKKAGVEVFLYRPLRWYNIGRFNNRTHRKLLIADGRVGFTGGVGIAGLWTGNAQDPDHWRDTHFRAEGPVVAQMQAVFADNWVKTTGKVLHGADYFPGLTSKGTALAQTFSSSPTGGSESMRLMYLLAISAASKSIHLSSSYFVPDALTKQALVDAVKRGVKVQIIMPGKNMDADTVRRASRGGWGPLLEAGVEIFEYQPTMFHVKALVVDGLMTSVGSTNFDDRSLRLNDEANLNVYDETFAAKQIAVFAEDMAKSKRITFEQWNERPFREKALEHAAAFLGPLL